MDSSLSRERIADRTLEWLETDGLGGFASGTPGGIRTRRYHGLLVTARRPPTGRLMLVNGLEVWIDAGSGSCALVSHHYAPDVVHPDGDKRLISFSLDPYPSWTFELEEGLRIEQRLALTHGSPTAVVTWSLSRFKSGARLFVRPLLSVRDVHGLSRANSRFCFDAKAEGPRVRWEPYPDLTAVVALSNGAYRHDPLWYRSFLYAEDRARGYDYLEDLGSPGLFAFEIGKEDSVLILGAEGAGLSPPFSRTDASPSAVARDLLAQERERRASFSSPLDRAAEQYIVSRESSGSGGPGKTIVAGYPWFADWGRDTFIALRGLCLALERLEDASSILRTWAGLVNQGMLPNRFVEVGEEPEFNSVDASLWFIVAAGEYLKVSKNLRPGEQETLEPAVREILGGYTAGTRYRIHMDDDGLLAAGEEGSQLTWMDAKVGDSAITPRIGKPVEVQALWINALAVGTRIDRGWLPIHKKARRSFEQRFWNESAGCLYDVVDENQVPGRADASLRPNQILAVGGLPLILLSPERAKRVVETVETKLWTPLGLRSLAPDDPRYVGVYQGGQLERDRAYHQGTVWSWLIGPFVEAWLRVRGSTPAMREEARARFLAPLLAHLGDAGLGHVSEIADGDPPHTPRGAPFQAWSLGELLRLERSVLGPETGATLGAAARQDGIPEQPLKHSR